MRFWGTPAQPTPTPTWTPLTVHQKHEDRSKKEPDSLKYSEMLADATKILAAYQEFPKKPARIFFWPHLPPAFYQEGRS